MSQDFIRTVIKKMKSIFNVSENKEVKVNITDLPMLVHGREHSGASLFPITVASQIHRDGGKLLFFTAYSMAKDEFLTQLEDLAGTVFYLESENDILKAGEFQTIIVKSGDERLFLSVLEELPNLSDYTPFIKNVEVITEPDIVGYATSRPSIIAGDVTKSIFKDDLLSVEYSTTVMFTPFEEGQFANLQKYQAKMSGKDGEKIVAVK